MKKEAIVVGTNFGTAIEYLKTRTDVAIARRDWNGKDMFVFMRPADEIPLATVVEKVKSLPTFVKNHFDSHYISDEHGETPITFTPYLCMKAADDTIVNGWLASQADMLANDWDVLTFVEA